MSFVLLEKKKRHLQQNVPENGPIIKAIEQDITAVEAVEASISFKKKKVYRKTYGLAPVLTDIDRSWHIYFDKCSPLPFPQTPFIQVSTQGPHPHHRPLPGLTVGGVNAVHGVALNLPKIHHKTTRFFLSVMSHRAESYVISMFMYIQYVHVLIYGSSRKSHHPRQAMYSSIYNVSSNKTQVKSFKPSQITKESHSIGEFQTSRICHGSKSYTLKPIIALPEKTSANFSEEKFPHPKFHLRRDRYRRRGWSRLEIRMVPDDPVKRPPRLNSEWFKL